MTNSERAGVMFAGVAIIVLTMLLQSFGQGREQSPTINKNAGPSNATTVTPTQQDPAGEDFSKNTWSIPADADQTKNPIPATEESVARGKELYLTRKGNCVFCHGESGAGNQENLPKLRRKPADISNKERMSKLTDGELFWKISLGITGIMPGREKQMTEQERWDVVNYIRTLPNEKTLN